MSGTQGLTGSVDALLLPRRERGQMDAALYVTGRDIEHEQDYALQFDPESCTWSSIGNVHEARVTRERAEILSFLRKNGPSKPKDIAEGLEKKGPAIRRLLQKMLADAEVCVTDGRYVPVTMPATNVISFLDAGRRRLAKQIAAIEAELELGLLTMKVMARLRTFPEMDGCTMSSSELYRFVHSQLRAKLIVEKNRK